jgi:hypothetical protein
LLFAALILCFSIGFADSGLIKTTLGELGSVYARLIPTDLELADFQPQVVLGSLVYDLSRPELYDLAH